MVRSIAPSLRSSDRVRAERIDPGQRNAPDMPGRFAFQSLKEVVSFDAFVTAVAEAAMF